MSRDEIKKKILVFFKEEFEIEDPDLDSNLRENYEFDSIDAIILLEYFEELIDSPLTHEEKKNAMEIYTINQIVDYIENLIRVRG